MKKKIFDFISSAAAATILNAVLFNSFKPTISFIILFAICIALSSTSPKNKGNGKILFPFIFICTLLTLSINWGLKTFPLKNIDQTLMTLSMPLDGFIAPFVSDYIKTILIPCVILSLLSINFAKKIIYFVRTSVFCIIITLITFIHGIIYIATEIPIQDYIYEYSNYTEANVNNSQFFNDYYCPADSVILSKDSNTNNLILILAESIENYPPEYIPKIYDLKTIGGQFLNGGNDIPGSVNTISATVSKTTGIPLFSVRNNQLKELVQNKTHLKKAPSIYSLLQKEGYFNVFAQGSDAIFAGTEDYLLQHGINKIYDSKVITEGHDVDEKFWKDIKKKLPHFNPFSSSISDKSLFETTKKILDTLSKKDNFTLSIATIDTHYPYGFYNNNCQNKPTDNSELSLYKASLICSSEALFDFIAWVQKQSYAKNTTIAVISDHLFMGELADSLHNQSTKRKWITVFINEAQSLNKPHLREYTSLDIAPTLIESLGFSINTRKIGFGVSLYSDLPTLYESLGQNNLSNQLKQLVFSKEYLSLY